MDRRSTTVGGGQSAIANFGSVTFTNASATINGVTGPINSASWQSQAINMESNSGSVLDVTSVLVSSGTSFVVTYGSTGGSKQGSGNRSGSSLEVIPTFGTNPLARKTESSVVIGPAWTGASSLWSSRTSVRQGKVMTGGFSTGSLFDS